MEEARDARQRVAAAAEILDGHLKQADSADQIETDLARLERVSLDLQRRVEAARNALAGAEPDPLLSTELDQLEDYVRSMLLEVERVRDRTPD